jgi:hypothetical protein
MFAGAAFSMLAVLPSAPQVGPPQVQQSQAEKDMMDRQIKELNKKRQQDMRDDAEKLFQLATELKAAVEKSNENLLSLEVVRKAEELEKLAHRVREKMKQSAGPPMKSEPPSLLPPRR